MALRPRSPRPIRQLHRYLVAFAWPNDDHLTTPVGVTAFSIEDAIDIIKTQWRLAKAPVPLQVEEDVDLSAIPADFWKAPVGPSSMRGIWYPFFRIE